MSIDAIFCVCMDPWAEAKGGQGRFANQMLHAFGDRVAVAGVTGEELPLRKWIDRPFYDKTIKFFNMGFIKPRGEKKPIIPLRLTVYIYATISMSKIYSTGIRNIFIESPEVLFAASKYNWHSVCYRFAGVSNPIKNSRYKWAKYLGTIFENKMFRDIKKMNVNSILASADNESINQVVRRSKGKLNNNIIHHFPTRVDNNLFRPSSKVGIRKVLNISEEEIIIVACGRLNWIKGWDLILDSLKILKEDLKDVKAIFIGDGEDKSKLLFRAKELKIERNILITGFISNIEVQNYINAADLCVVASRKEGWSLAMLEMLACGKAIVSTNVSGANEMINSGYNGFIVKERDPMLFADAIKKALQLKYAYETSLKLSEKYSTKNLADDIGLLWPALKK